MTVVADFAMHGAFLYVSSFQNKVTILISDAGTAYVEASYHRLCAKAWAFFFPNIQRIRSFMKPLVSTDGIHAGNSDVCGSTGRASACHHRQVPVLPKNQRKKATMFDVAKHAYFHLR